MNPKDPPFLTFFLASVCLGFEMVDSWIQEEKPKFKSVILPAILLGITTSIRILGPLAGLLVAAYCLILSFQGRNLRVSASPWILLFAYVGLSVVTVFITWPYLWESPFTRLIDVFRFMSDNPTNLSVLFRGNVYRAGELPRSYLPTMLTITLTEPVWLLFLVGLLTGFWKLITEFWRRETASPALHTSKLAAATLTLLWFVVVVAYALIRKPAMYDGFRHFQFILPPVFIFTGFGFEFILERLPQLSQPGRLWLHAGLILGMLAPGIVGISQLHPYEYTYYNSFVGGTSGAFRSYETDFWLTCYKEAVEQLNENTESITLFVHREAYIAEYYAADNIAVRERRDALAEIQSGDYILVNTRTNEDRRILRDVEPILQIQRGNAVFCLIKRVP